MMSSLANTTTNSTRTKFTYVAFLFILDHTFKRWQKNSPSQPNTTAESSGIFCSSFQPNSGYPYPIQSNARAAIDEAWAWLSFFFSFFFFLAYVKSSHHALVRLLFSFGRLNSAICVCNLIHNDFLNSLDLDLWTCGNHDFLLFYFSLDSCLLYKYLHLGSTWSDVCIYPAFVSLFTYTIIPLDRNPGLLFLFPSFLLGAQLSGGLIGC